MYSSRKFIVALVAIVGATVLVYTGKIVDGVYATVVVAVVSGYYTANVSQKLGTKPQG